MQPEPELPQLNLPDGITMWDAATLDEERRSRNADGHADRLMLTINILGKRSRVSQNLNVVLTSVSRICENKSRLYLACSGGYGVGILKVGVKKLFVTHPSYPSLVEIDPLCVLDFFVDTCCQRQGFGKMLFDFMLATENLVPGEVAIDRPSDKFLAFLQRHYGLEEYTPQSNNFVVFHRYFDGWKPQRRRGIKDCDAWRSVSPGWRQQHRQPHGVARGGDAHQNANDLNTRDKPSVPYSLVLQEKQPTAQRTAAVAPSLPQKKNLTAYELQYERYLQEQAYQSQQRASWGRRMQKPGSPVEIAEKSSGVGCRTSPSRSGVPYNIINGAPTR